MSASQSKFPLHTALDKLGASPTTGRIRGALSPTQKQTVGTLARHIGVSSDTVERLVTGTLAGSPAPLAELQKVAHYLDGAFHKPSTQADASKRGRVASLHASSLQAHKQVLSARTAALAQAQQAHHIEQRSRALATADQHLDAAVRRLSSLGTLPRGAARDRAAEGAKRSILQAQASLRAGRQGPQQPEDPRYVQVQARAKTLWAELKSIA